MAPKFLNVKDFIKEGDEHQKIVEAVEPDCRGEIPERVSQIEGPEVSHVAFPCVAEPRGCDQGTGEMEQGADNPAEPHDAGEFFAFRSREVVILVDQVFKNCEGQPAERASKRKLPRETQEPCPFFQKVDETGLFEEFLHERREKEDVQDYKPGTFRTEKRSDHCKDAAEKSCQNGCGDDLEDRMMGDKILEPEFIIRISGVLAGDSA